MKGEADRSLKYEKLLVDLVNDSFEYSLYFLAHIWRSFWIKHFGRGSILSGTREVVSA